LQFNQFIAIEAGYISFGQSSANTSYNFFPVNEKDSFAGFDVLVKGILPVNNKFNLFVKLGTADMNDKGSDSGSGLPTETGTTSTWTPLVGLGASYSINEHVSFSLQDMYSGQTSYHANNLDMEMPALNAILAGVSFKFNA
jgi:OmpA-like transmembrane domain